MSPVISLIREVQYAEWKTISCKLACHERGMLIVIFLEAWIHLNEVANFKFLKFWKLVLNVGKGFDD